MKRSLMFLAAVGLAAANVVLIAHPSEAEAFFDSKETCANSGSYYFCENYITVDCDSNPNCDGI